MTEIMLKQILLNQIAIMKIIVANDGHSSFVVSDADAEQINSLIKLSGELIQR